MSIATEITRLQTAKADLKTAIEAKGVSVPSSALISDYDTYVSQITGGGGTGTTIPNFTSGHYLFYGNRFISIYPDLVNKFVGIACPYMFVGLPTGDTIKASIINAMCNKALNNAANVSGTSNVNFQYLTNGGGYIDNTDNDLNIDASGIVLSRNVNLSTSSMITTSSSGQWYNDITLNFINGPITGKIFGIVQSLGTLRFTGTFTLDCYFNAIGTLTPFTTNAGSLPTGTIGYLHIVPVYNDAVINLSALPDTLITENVVINSLAQYTLSETDDKGLTIRLPANTFNNLQQSTIDAATALDITLTS